MNTQTKTTARNILFITILFFTFTAGPLDAATVRVPDDYPTIQDGINAASAGDTVAVASGTYTGVSNKTLNFYGKDIVLKRSGRLPVVIDCEGDGRGIGLFSGETPAAVIENITIINGDATVGGGVVCESTAAVTLRFCEIRDCRAQYRGGGISVWGAAAGTVIDGCTISGCSVDNTSSYGGGIHITTDGVTVQNCVISANLATSTESAGGGVYVSEAVGVSVTGCDITYNQAYWGGGLELFDAAVDISSCTISGNHAEYVGGAMECTYSTCSMSDVLVSFNSSGRWYGGAYFASSDADLANCSFQGNLAGDNGGGAGFYDSVIDMSDCSFNGNTALNGGGFYAYVDCSGTLDGCCISGNTATGNGGGIACEVNAPFYITNCTFHENSAASGGGVYLSESSPVLLDCSISDNEAHLGGGMYACLNSSPGFYTVEIQDNSAVSLDVIGGRGGALFLDGVAGVYLSNCMTTGNTATGNGAKGGAVFSDLSVFELMNCTLADNVAFSMFGDPLGGGIYCGDSEVEITNGILWGDEPDEIHCEGSSSTNVSYTDIEGGWLGLFNLDADPRFVYPGGGDYHLNASSPCVDAGSGFGAPLSDFEGDFRPTGDGWDMGADEYVCDLSVELSGYPSTMEPGETLSFTAAAVNDCDEPHSFDKADMVIEGPAGLVKSLYNGSSITIPAGGQVSAPVNLYVPLNAPAGVYTITVIIYRTFLWSFPIASDTFSLEVLN